MELDTLVAGCKTGDEVAWEALVRRMQGRIFGLCYHYLRDREEARDVAQETFIRIYRGIDSFDGGGSFLARTSRDDAHRRAWRRLERDLPMLASMTPDEGFVADVMAATARADRRRFGDRLRALWQEMIRRPRLALEGAYVAAVLVLLLFGLPGSPLADVPGTVLTELRDGSAAVRTGVAGGAERTTELGRTTWRRTGEVLTTPVAGFGAAEPATIRAWRSTAGRLFQGVWETTLAPAIEWARSAWLRVRGRESPSPAEITRGVDDGRDLQSA